MLPGEYQKTLDYLFRQLPMFQRVGATAFKKDLTNIKALCDHLGQPHTSYPNIHIGGTNGKGSTAHMLSAVLQAAGFKVGLYTSPHYRDFRERVKINGQLMDAAFVVQFVAQHKTLFEKIKPSFFEITVAMAFEYFAQQKVDIAVIEVGLGGRLDSTNIITPVAALITNISYDHQQFLGDTLPEIAGEKAGIIKSGIPAVIGETHPETEGVFKTTAARVNAPVYFADQHFQAIQTKISGLHAVYDIYKDEKLLYPAIHLQSLGHYQYKNLQNLFQLLDVLPPPYQLDESSIRKGLASLQQLSNFIGRWQILERDPLILCDSAHNEAGIALAMEGIQQLSFEQLHIVWGMSSDKEPAKILKYLPRDATYYFCKPNVPRGQDPYYVKEQASSFSLSGEVYSSVSEALDTAKKQAKPNDLIYIGGSIFVVAEVV